MGEHMKISAEAATTNQQLINEMKKRWKEADINQPDPIIEIEFLDWVHPLMGVIPCNKFDGTPVVLRARIRKTNE